MFTGLPSGQSPTLAPQHMALIPPERLSEIQQRYMGELAAYVSNPNALEIKDRRFSGKAWQS
ncbi:MAG: class I poly(R)-hydroxyalkanoic acid synthase, partial [Polynucleobacter sp.]|nr:class I poly(R)-hydroxyalkanoic acid synthase [Polynucleobacter sp.]